MTPSRLRIFMLSLHGLVRGRDPELGRDADTGGQVTYVLELARALGRHPAVERVDLLTRLIADPSLSPDYAVPEEPLGGKARLLRLPFGPSRYLRKEVLWNHLDALVDRCLELFRSEERLPDLIHSHYADAGYVGLRLSQSLAIPLVHTGHSLGRVKRRRLLESGRKATALERQFNFERRIAAEEDTLAHVSLLVASTKQEIRDQYGAYENFDARRGLVIPPGADLARFTPPARGRTEERAIRLLDRFLTFPGKPLVLAVCRPVEQKNIARLVEAYGTDDELTRSTNLAIVAGSRDDVRKADESQRQVLTDLLLDIDRYDLWGKVAIPKRHAPEDVPELYRLAARRHGVFVDAALSEPFGLTLLEAAASGVPIVATEDGGPRDILENCRNGLLVDPLDPRAIAEALKQVVWNGAAWHAFSRNGLNGVRRHYTWEGHVQKYVKAVSQVLRRERKQIRRRIGYAAQEAPPLRDFRYAVITDIDRTLLGDEAGLARFLAWLHARANDVLFGVATGRVLPQALEILERWGVSVPDVLITSVGAEIHYGPSLAPDASWARHIRHRWRRDALEEAMGRMPGLTLQPPEKQGPFKLSYDVDPPLASPVEAIQQDLQARGLAARLIYSQAAHLDLLPVRASKGLAIRHLAYRKGVPLRRFLVAGDSGNDTEMLVGDTLAVVVGNHSPELEGLRGIDQIYFAEKEYADGILEGVEHYGFAPPEVPAGPAGLHAG